MVLGLISAVLLLFGGCTAYVTGSLFQGVEEAFDVEVSGEESVSTTEDIAGSGAVAILVSILLFLGAGLAKVALKTSLAILALIMPMLIGLVVVDTTSLFAAVYYLAIVLVGTGVVLMVLAYVKSRRSREA